jgi:hypothetical protein
LSNTVFVINYFIKYSIGVLIYEHSHFTPSNITKIFDKDKRKRKKNFKNVRIERRKVMRYIGIIILLVLCLTLLLLTGCIVNTVISETTSGNLENQENTEEPVMWSGLGMHLFPTSDNTYPFELSPFFDDWVDELLANGFTQIRIDVTYWADASAIAISKSAITLAVSKGAQVIWGVGAGATTLTSTNWPDFRQAILNAAQWAQDNGVYEFQIGNEEEAHVDGITITGSQMITNLKDVATEVQAIFTRGNVSYSYVWGYDDDWIAAGKGDIDIIAFNLYIDGEDYYSDGWKTIITNLVNAFGVDGTYLTEFGPSYSSLDDYSTDEAVQAAAVTEMIEYIKAPGMKRAIFFCYYDDSRPFGVQGFGVLKTDGNYRLLWNQALLNSGSVKSITVPVKTATISLPNTIALIHK